MLENILSLDNFVDFLRTMCIEPFETFRELIGIICTADQPTSDSPFKVLNQNLPWTRRRCSSVLAMFAQDVWCAPLRQLSDPLSKFRIQTRKLGLWRRVSRHLRLKNSRSALSGITSLRLVIRKCCLILQTVPLRF